MAQTAEERIALLERTIADLSKRLAIFEQTAILRSSRVQIENFEGCLKTFSSEPSVATFIKNGSIFLVDAGDDHKIGVNLNGTLRYTGVT